MKGGGRKEPPVGGEVACKRPKRKCLQWHPLLSKKALDFSEEEEEEDEEELEKVSAFGQANVARLWAMADLSVWNALSAGRALPPGAGLTGTVWKHNWRGGGGLQRTTGETADECLPSLLQTPPLAGAAGASSSGQSRGHQDPGRLVGSAGPQRKAEIHWHGQGGKSFFCARQNSRHQGAAV